jgi:hypothetical protein
MARLKTEIWVHALLRSNQVEGRFGAVIHKGAEEAGAVYIYINHLDGTYDLLAPPPGAAFDDNGERRFILENASPTDWQVVAAIVARRRKYDSDIWAVEIEDRLGFGGIVPEKNQPLGDY